MNEYRLYPAVKGDLEKAAQHVLDWMEMTPPLDGEDCLRGSEVFIVEQIAACYEALRRGDREAASESLCRAAGYCLGAARWIEREGRQR